MAEARSILLRQHEPVAVRLVFGREDPSIGERIELILNPQRRATEHSHTVLALAPGCANYCTFFGNGYAALRSSEGYLIHQALLQPGTRFL